MKDKNASKAENINKPKEKKAQSVQTVNKTLLTNLVRLTKVADQKAALMISVNSIIISLTVSFMINQTVSNPNLLIPTVILLMVCLFAIIFSILGSRPKVDTQDEQEIDLLFFGHYSKLGKDEYVKEMKDLIKNEKNLQEKIFGNIHTQGEVLNAKYLNLKISYLIFLVGFPLSIILYIIALFVTV